MFNDEKKRKSMKEYTAEEKEKIKAFMNRLDEVYRNKEYIASPLHLPEWSELPLDLQVELIPKFLDVQRFCDIMESLHNNMKYYIPLNLCNECGKINFEK